MKIAEFVINSSAAINSFEINSEVTEVIDCRTSDRDETQRLQNTHPSIWRYLQLSHEVIKDVSFPEHWVVLRHLAQSVNVNSLSIFEQHVPINFKEA